MTDFENYLFTQKQFINKNLLRYLPPKPQSKLPDNKLINAIYYSLLTGGKRLRPIMCIESAKMFSKNIANVLPFACALEFIHTYSLIHDDLPCMDNDNYRRGKLTVHKKYNEATALLTGNVLFGFAFEILSKFGFKKKT